MIIDTIIIISTIFIANNNIFLIERYVINYIYKRVTTSNTKSKSMFNALSLSIVLPTLVIRK